MDDLLKYYQELEKISSNVLKNVKSIASSTAGKAGIALGGLGVIDAASNLGGASSSYRDQATQIKSSDLQFKAAGRTIEEIGKRGQRVFGSLSSSIEELGKTLKTTFTNAGAMDQTIATMAGRTGTLSKVITGLAQTSKIAFGTLATVYLGASVAYEQYIDKSIKKSDELIKKQQEIANSFKANMGNIQGSDSYKSGLAYSRTNVASQTLFAGGLPGGRMAANNALQQGAERGFNTQNSTQIVQLSQQIAMAQGKALEPVLKDIMGKAFISFIGKSDSERSQILRRQQLISGTNYLSYGPGVKDSLDDAYMRAGRGLSQAKSSMGSVGNVFNRMLAGSGYDYEDNPLYSKFFDRPTRGAGAWFSQLGGKITKGLTAPFVTLGDQAGRFGTAGTGILGTLMSGSKVDRVSKMGKELQIIASGQQAGREADSFDQTIVGMNKEIEGTKKLKMINEMGAKSDAAAKRESEALDKIKSLQAKAGLVGSMSKEDREKYYKELEEEGNALAQAKKTQAEYNKAKNDSIKELKGAQVRTDTELKGLETNRDRLQEESAARRASENAINKVLPQSRVPGLDFEQTQDLGVLTSEFESSTTEYRKSNKRVSELLEKKAAGGTLTDKEKTELTTLTQGMQQYASTWVRGASDEDIQAFQEESTKLQQMKGSGVRGDLIKEQQKKVDELKKKVSIESGEQNLQRKQQAAIVLVQDKMKGSFKAEDVADIQMQASSMLESGIIDKGTQDQIKGILGGGFDIDAVKEAFKNKDSGKIFDLFKGKVSKEAIDKDISSGDMSSLFQKGLKLDPSQMMEASATLSLKNREYQRKRMQMNQEYQAPEKELQKGFMEYNVKELQQTGKFAEEEIKKVTDLLAQKDDLSRERAQKEISLMEKKYQLEEATQKLQMKGVERQYGRQGLSDQIGTMSGKGMLGSGEAKRLIGAIQTDGDQFDKASPIVQNILTIRENMYKKELEFTTQYTESRMNIIKAHYDKSIMMERGKLEGEDRKMAPYVQGAQGMMSAFGGANQAIGNRFALQNQAISDARSIRGMSEQRMMLGYQMSGVGVPESVQQAMAMRSQQEQEDDFRRQKTQEREGDITQLEQMGQVWSKLGAKGKGYGDFAKTEGGRAMLQNMLLQNQGALSRVKGIDVTPKIQELSNQQFEHEAAKMDLNLSEREKTVKMFEGQVGEMEKAIGGAEGQKKIDLAINMGGKYKEAAEYYSSIGEMDKAKSMSDKYIKTQEMVPGQLQNIKDEGMRQAVNQLEQQTKLLEIIAGVKSGGGAKGAPGEVPKGAIDGGVKVANSDGTLRNAPGGIVGSGVTGGSDFTKPLAKGVVDSSPTSGFNVGPKTEAAGLNYSGIIDKKDYKDVPVTFDALTGGLEGKSYEETEAMRKKIEGEFGKKAVSTGNNLKAAQRELNDLGDLSKNLETAQWKSIDKEVPRFKMQDSQQWAQNFADKSQAALEGTTPQEKALASSRRLSLPTADYSTPAKKYDLSYEDDLIKKRLNKEFGIDESKSNDPNAQANDAGTKILEAAKKFAEAKINITIKKDGNVNNHQIEYGRG